MFNLLNLWPNRKITFTQELVQDFFHQAVFTDTNLIHSIQVMCSHKKLLIISNKLHVVTGPLFSLTTHKINCLQAARR